MGNSRRYQEHESEVISTKITNAKKIQMFIILRSNPYATTPLTFILAAYNVPQLDLNFVANLLKSNCYQQMSKFQRRAAKFKNLTQIFVSL